jgi:riboflavin synthase alpha subunit
MAHACAKDKVHKKLILEVEDLENIEVGQQVAMRGMILTIIESTDNRSLIPGS